MKVVESINEYNELKLVLDTEPSIWYPMWVDNDKHPLNTTISFIFVRTQSDKYILPQQHTDALSLSNEQMARLLNTDGEKWVFQKKKLLQSFITPIRGGLNDVDTAYFLKGGQIIDYHQPIQHLVAPYLHKGYKEDIIQSIPILKLTEAIEPQLLKHINQKSKTYNWYNEIFIPILSEIERYGIRVDVKKFSDRWPQASKHLKGDLIFTEYNPFTVTGRPSNRHGGINFAALNKSDGTRDVFISDGIFLQMDYDAYHPRLIGKMMGFQLPQTSVHRWLAEQYGCDVGEGKGITFRLLYGGIDKEFHQIPYFKAVDEWITKVWEETSKNGYLQTRYRQIPLSWIEDANPQKVFNYLLQALETEINVDKMEDILNFIRGTDIKLSLYTYDSFLFDYPTDSDTQSAKRLKEIIEDGGFPIKASWGTDYGKV